MAPWLIFGAGGKGVGRQIAQLAIAKKRPVIVVVRNKQTVNIRRRVGDALSVLAAINYVKKVGNGYIWIRDNGSQCHSELDSLHFTM